MSDVINPYQGPETPVGPEKPLVAQGSLTETMLIHLKGASPWLRFIGVLGFVGAGFMALTGLTMFVLFPFMGSAWGEIPGFDSKLSGALGAVFAGGMALLIIGGGALIFFPSLFAYRFGDKIRGYLRTGMDQELELAFKNNKSFWKFYGIICIIYLAFIPLTVVGGIIAALVSVFIK